MLRAIREGIVVVDPQGRIELVNDEAVRLLALPEDAVGRSIDDLVPDRRSAGVLSGAAGTADGVHVVGDRVLVVGRRTARRSGRALATVTTLRDRTELEGLVRELATVARSSTALRAQAHESANELHTVVGLIELGRHEEPSASRPAASPSRRTRFDLIQQHVADPAVAALLLAKAATCREQGVHLELDTTTDLATGSFPPRI